MLDVLVAIGADGRVGVGAGTAAGPALREHLGAGDLSAGARDEPCEALAVHLRARRRRHPRELREGGREVDVHDERVDHAVRP